MDLGQSISALDRSLSELRRIASLEKQASNEMIHRYSESARRGSPSWDALADLDADEDVENEQQGDIPEELKKAAMEEGMRGFESGVASFLKKLDSSRSSLSTQELSTALRQSVANRAMRFGGSATSQRVIKTDVPSKVFAQQEPPSPPTPSTPGLDLTGMLSQWLSSPGGPPPQSAKASTVGEQERVEKSTLTSDNSRWVEPRQQRRGDYETPRPNFSDSEDTLARLGEDFSPATPLTPLFASQLQASRPRQMEIEALEENQSPPRSRRPSPTPLPQPSSRVAAANGTGSHGHYSPVQTGSTAGMSAQAGTPEAANSRIYSSMAAPTPAPGTSSMTSAQLPSLPYMQGGAPPSFVPLTHTTGKTQHEPLWGQASVQAQPSDQCSESESGSSVQQKPQMSGGHQRRAPKPQKRKTKKAAIPRSKPRLHKFAAGHSSKGPEVPRRITNLGHPPAETQTTSQKPAAAALSNPSQPRHSPSTVQQPSEQPVPTVLPRHSEPVTDDESNASVATPWDDSPAASWWELQQVGGPGPHQSAANNHPTAHRVSPTATPSSPYPAPESVVAYLQSQIDKLNERFLQQTREFHNLYEKTVQSEQAVVAAVEEKDHLHQQLLVLSEQKESKEAEFITFKSRIDSQVRVAFQCLEDVSIAAANVRKRLGSISSQVATLHENAKHWEETAVVATNCALEHSMAAIEARKRLRQLEAVGLDLREKVHTLTCKLQARESIHEAELSELANRIALLEGERDGLLEALGHKPRYEKII